MLQENDDMDELLRRAAENYPLKTDTADWEKVHSRLGAENFTEVTAEKRNRRAMWLLLLLLPLGWTAYHYIPHSISNNNNEIVKEAAAKNKLASQGIVKENAAPGERSKDEISSKEDQLNINEPVITQPGTSTALVQKNVFTKKIKPAIKSTVSTNDLSTVYNNTNNTTEQGNTAFDKTNTKIADNTEVNNTQGVEKNPVSKETNKNIAPETATTGEINNGDKTSKKESKKNKQKDKFIYIGVVAGPDMSLVKMQSIKKTGFNAGVVLGYVISKRWSIETGIAWNKKYYYSEGSYFKTNKINLPPAAKITDVDGNCKMIDIPVTVKYNFKSSGKSHLSAGVGISSYFMKQETYNYTIVSTGQPYPYKKTYKNPSRFLPATVDLSTGYNRKIGKVGTIGIEPYVKIPLKGVGIGSLPITSAGINIGFTRKLF